MLAATLAFGLTCNAAAVPAETAPPATTATETNLRILLDTVRTNRRALLAVNLGLDDEESAKFWPVYERYAKEVEAIGDRVLAMVQEYEKQFGNLSNEKALQLSRDYLEAESERAKVRLSYLDEFARILPGRTVARFYQIENKMDALLRYELAATIPVIEPGGAPAR